MAAILGIIGLLYLSFYFFRMSVGNRSTPSRPLYQFLLVAALLAHFRNSGYDFLMSDPSLG